MENENENVIAYISLPNMPTVDGAVAVRGDSMYPIIKSGGGYSGVQMGEQPRIYNLRRDVPDKLYVGLRQTRDC